MSTILIAEDEPTILMLAESFLQDAGFETLSAGNGAQALALLDSGATLDALVTDIDMGEGPNGLSVAIEAVQRVVGLPVVYASGANMTDGLKAQMVEHAVFLAKPYDGPGLIAALAEAMSRR
jgi:CheY-like chemotaxis protein